MQRGFICPECRVAHHSADALQTHYNKAHSHSPLESTTAPDETFSFKDKLAAYVIGIKNSGRADNEDSAFDGSDASRDDSDNSSGSNKSNSNELNLKMEVDRLTMENEALKRHLLDSEGRCDTLKTCLADLENGNFMLQSHLESTNTQISVLHDQIKGGVAVSMPTCAQDDAAADAERKNLAWFYRTLETHVQRNESITSILKCHNYSIDECDSMVDMSPSSLQHCPSAEVLDLVRFILLELEAARKFILKTLSAEQASENGSSAEIDRVVVVEALHKENATLDQTLRTVRAEPSEADQERSEAEKRITALRCEMKALHVARDEAKKLLDSALKDKEDCSGQVQHLRGELSKSEETVSELHKLNKEQSVIINKVEQQLAACTIELDLRNAEICSIQTELSQLKEEHLSERNSLQEECQRLNEELNNATGLAEQLRTTVVALTDDHRDKELMLQQRIDTMTDQLVELRRESFKMRCSIEKAEENLHNSELQCSELNNQLELNKEEAKVAARRLENAEANYSNKVHEFEELKRKYDQILAALQEIGLQHSNLQVDVNQLLTRKWEDDALVTSCVCGKAFSVTVRKHHCRSCGSIFCNDCSNHVANVVSYKKAVRVCNACHEKLSASQ